MTGIGSSRAHTPRWSTFQQLKVIRERETKEKLTFAASQMTRRHNRIGEYT